MSTSFRLGWSILYCSGWDAIIGRAVVAVGELLGIPIERAAFANV
jgi:hypothetical protein